MSCPGNSLWQLRNPMRRIMNTKQGNLYSMNLHLRSSIRVLLMPMGRHLWESTFRLPLATCAKLWHSEPNILVLKIKWLTSMKHRASGKKTNSWNPTTARIKFHWVCERAESCTLQNIWAKWKLNCKFTTFLIEFLDQLNLRAKRNHWFLRMWFHLRNHGIERDMQSGWKWSNRNSQSRTRLTIN